MRRAQAILSLPIFASLVAAMPSRTETTTSVPVRLFGTEMPVVVVHIQGKDLPLQLDMGDDLLVIHPDVLATLSTTPTGRTAKFFGMDGSFETPIVRLDEVTIGSLTFRNVDTRKDEHDPAYLTKKKTIVGSVGSIGNGLFKSGQVLLDYPRHHVAFSLPSETGSLGNICQGIRIPFVANQYGWTTPVLTDMGELQLGWDTGSPAILLSQTAAATAHLDPNLKKIRTKTFTVGGKDFGPQRIEIWNNIPLPPDIAGLIGYPFFKKHVVCFDYPNQLLHVR